MVVVRTGLGLGRNGVAIRVAWIVTLLAWAATPTAGGDRPLWGDLTPGPYAVGFDVLWLRDASRVFGPGTAAAP